MRGTVLSLLSSHPKIQLGKCSYSKPVYSLDGSGVPIFSLLAIG
jgi:hypothetical protein